MREKKGYKNVVAWQQADKLAFEIYIVTKNFPEYEKFGITSQLRRAALSIPTNIVEGHGRQGEKEFKYFVNISLGSLAEVDYLIDFSLKLKNLYRDNHKKLQKLRDVCGKLLWKFYKSFG